MRGPLSRVAAPDSDVPSWLYVSLGELRAPWRLVTFGVTLALATGIVGAIVGPLFAMLSRSVGEPIPAYPWITLAAVWWSILVALRLVDDAPWSAMGLHRHAWRFNALGGGAFVGAVAIVATTVLLLVTGALRFHLAPLLLSDSASLPIAWSATFLRVLLLLAPAALWEELVFRGYLWTVAERAGGTRLALWSTSAAFGLLHITNPGSGVRTTLLVLLAGVCLGLVRARWNSLPAAWLAHLVWNLTMAAGLHAPVSGVPFDAPGYQAVLSGPAWWSGGAWGPEGGAAACVVLMTLMLVSFRRSLASYDVLRAHAEPRTFTQSVTARL